MSLDKTTAALRKALDKLEHPERPSAPPPPLPAELSPERIAEIAAALTKSHPILSMLGMAGVRPAELVAFCAAAKRGAK